MTTAGPYADGNLECALTTRSNCRAFCSYTASLPDAYSIKQLPCFMLAQRPLPGVYRSVTLRISNAKATAVLYANTVTTSGFVQQYSERTAEVLKKRPSTDLQIVEPSEKKI
jgi:hypothetical protein